MCRKTFTPTGTAIGIVIVAIVLVTLAVIVPPQFMLSVKEAKEKPLNTRFEHKGYEVTVMQTDNTDGRPQILISDGKNLILATTRYQRIKANLWTGPFVILDRSNCDDPNSPLYSYTWENFEELRIHARQLEEAKKTMGPPFTEETGAKILEAGITERSLYRPETAK